MDNQQTALPVVTPEVACFVGNLVARIQHFADFDARRQYWIVNITEQQMQQWREISKEKS